MFRMDCAGTGLLKTYRVNTRIYTWKYALNAVITAKAHPVYDAVQQVPAISILMASYW